MLKQLDYTWKEVYETWKAISYRKPMVNKKLLVNKIKVNQREREGSSSYNLDWVLTEDLANRTGGSAISGDGLNKGALRTLKYLVETEDEETRAAIWIYAFVRDITECTIENWCGDGYEITGAIESATLLYLKEKGIEWHHAMKRLLPDICFSFRFLEAFTIKDKRVFLELAALAVDYIYMHYKVVEYDSGLNIEEI